MMSRSSLTIASLLLALASAHCTGVTSGTNAAAGTTSGGAGSSTLSTTPADFCRSFCDRASTCDTSRDSDTCANRCENELASLLPKLRGDLVAGVEACWQRNDCKHVLSSSSALGSCVDEAEESLAPTPAGTAFCEGLDASWKKCGVSLDRSRCLHLAKQYNDAALQDASSCLDKACSTIDACIASALDLSAVSGTPSPSPSPTPSPSPSPPTGPSADGGANGAGGSSGSPVPAPPG